MRIIVWQLLLLSMGAYSVLHPFGIVHAQHATVTTNCTLIVPPHPLSAQGLATPYQLTATNPEDGPCHEANPNQAAFVQGAVLNAATGHIALYNPLVIDKDTQPAIAPVMPELPANAIVALWFGFNGTNLTLQAEGDTLQDAQCVNGADDTVFMQFAYCNAVQFFAAANQAIAVGRLIPPPVGLAKDGLPCPTVRDFSVVDQDQSDNVTVTYLVTGNGQVAQTTIANKAALPNATLLTNASDNLLLAGFIAPALGCIPWMLPDLANPGQLASALPLNELQAATRQLPPVALVPSTDPMVLNNGMVDVRKLNAYRQGVNQPLVAYSQQASPVPYCQNLVGVGAPRIVLDAPFTVNTTTPDAAVGNTLFTFLAQRFVNTYANLRCQQLLGTPSPLATTQNGNGVAISATFYGQPVNTQGTGQTNATAPNCNINGVVLNGCTGAVNIQNQSCTLLFADNTLTMNCEAQS